MASWRSHTLQRMDFDVSVWCFTWNEWTNSMKFHIPSDSRCPVRNSSMFPYFQSSDPASYVFFNPRCTHARTLHWCRTSLWLAVLQWVPSCSSLPTTSAAICWGDGLVDVWINTCFLKSDIVPWWTKVRMCHGQGRFLYMSIRSLVSLVLIILFGILLL